MWVLALLVLLGSTPAGLPGRTKVQPAPMDPVTAALWDCRMLGPQAKYYRWMYIGGTASPKEVDEWTKALSSHCNRLSREPDIVLPTKASGDGRLLRINLLEYGWYDRRDETWERLVDPYFTYKIRTKDQVSGKFEGAPEAKGKAAGNLDGLNPRQQMEALTKAGKGYKVVQTETYTKDGETWTFRVEADGELLPVRPDSVEGRANNQQGSKDATKDKQESNAGKVKIAFAPWFPPEASKELIERTQSRMPIVDARWFLAQTAIQADRVPGYYDFLGIKDEKDFDAAVGFDANILKTFPKEHREAVSISTVALQPRRIDRAGTVGGGYWRTSDSRQAVDAKNPLRVLDDNFKFDARESFGHLPNGMFAWGLFDKDGKRQDTAPDFIASDNTSPNTDRRVHVNLSCVRCHTSGVQDIKGWVRSTFQPPFALQSADPVELKRLQRLYMTRVEPYINLDRQIYAGAILQATGLKTEDDAALYSRKFAEYEAITVDRAWAAKDLEVTEGQFVTGLRNSLHTTGRLDPLLVNYLGANIPLSIRQWEEVRSLAKTIMLGIAPEN